MFKWLMRYLKERKRPSVIKGFNIYDNTDILHEKYPLAGDRITNKSTTPLKAISYHAIIDHMCSKIKGKRYYNCVISTVETFYTIEIWDDANPMIIIDDLEEYEVNPVYKLLGNLV